MSTAISDGTRWARPYPARHPAPALRLFCFPYAGAGASVFRDWRLPEDLGVELWAVQPPGRENRRNEPSIRRMPVLVRSCADELAPLLEDTPYAFFGHSMGALVAFELARLRQSRGERLPVHLFLSAHRAPDRPPKRGPVSTLPDDEFLERLLEMVGSSRTAVVDLDLLLMLAPMIRADLELCEHYRYRPGPPLATPMTCFAAIDDSEVDVPDVAAWQLYTTGAFRLHTYTGGHTFLRDHAAQLCAEMGAAIAGTGRRR